MGLSLGTVTATVCEPPTGQFAFSLAPVPCALAMTHRPRVPPPLSAAFLWLTAAAVFTLPFTLQPDQRRRASANLPPQEIVPLAGPNRDFPWWPWILAFPGAGGLLWWLLRETAPTFDQASTIAPTQAATDRRIILTPRSSHAAYAYWELPPSEVDALQRRNYGFFLKVHDVTDIDRVDRQAPHTTEILACPTAAIGDCHLPIPQANRDYLVELGYGDESATWHALVRSEPVRVPAQPAAIDVPTLGAAAIGMPAIGTPAVETAPRIDAGFTPGPGSEAVRSRVADAAIPHPGTTAAMASLSAQTCRSACARWEIPPDQVTDLRTGKRRLTVRLYDVTELPGFLASNPNSVQEFEAELAPQADRVLPIAVDDRDYLIEVGYVSGSGHWHVLAKSSPVRVPAC